MKQNLQQEKKTPQFTFAVILVAAAAVILVITISPWNLIPVQVTEDVMVIATTEQGCIAESALGYSVLVSDCDAVAGDIVSATFYVPAKEQNGYYDRIEARLGMVIP